jgi:hypothetical protein
MKELSGFSQLHDRSRWRWFIRTAGIRQRHSHHHENQNRHSDQAGESEISDINMPKLMIASDHARDHQSTQRFAGD